MAIINEEIWNNIPGFPGYMASNYGRIKSLRKEAYNAKSNALCWRKERVLSNKPSMDGYISVSLKTNSSKRTWLAHRLIALAFHSKPVGKDYVNHINGNKSDNRPVNLEWCTKSENGVHAVMTGLHTPLRGERNGNSKLNKKDVVAIREMSGNAKNIAKMFGIGRTTVMYIKSRRLWAHI